MLLRDKFIEADLPTKFAGFNIRVYPDDQGKEIVVLSTKNLDISKPVLVRVHSECMTGDLFGSLRCDCGNQLSKSLKMISKFGGVLIYLRQEGRGIGLYNKIKTYQLQSAGCDTYEANILIGHSPDERSYEIVKTILDDLNIHKIKLLTNNPSKISDIASMGIEVVERIPVISRSNPHNKKYLETKREKFQHFLLDGDSYMYQFSCDSSGIIGPISEFISNYKKDPMLKIGVAISCNRLALINHESIENIKNIISEVRSCASLTPVIHFSFQNSDDKLKDVKLLKELFPQVERLQINDVEDLTVDFLREVSRFYAVNLPISDENVDLIYNKEFRKFVLKNKVVIVLDNSKGRGREDHIDSYKNKIDLLLAYGINKICLCGGFGPDKLKTFFDLKRHYRINFSIDAESRLKSDGASDIKKIKTYLLQLLRSDTPYMKGIAQTRNFLSKIRLSKPEIISIMGHNFMIYPNVFHAGHFSSSAWFAEQVLELVKNESDFCEVGCGSGITSCMVALKYPQIKVVATDLSEYACENTRMNINNLGLVKNTEVFVGDVFEGINSDSKFDSIFWLMPFGYLDPGSAVSVEEAQVFDPGYRSIRKFFETCNKHLKPSGRLLIGFSSDLGSFSLLQELAKQNQIYLTKIRQTFLTEENQISFELYEGLRLN